jgi:hypothetical protein
MLSCSNTHEGRRNAANPRRLLLDKPSEHLQSQLTQKGTLSVKNKKNAEYYYNKNGITNS